MRVVGLTGGIATGKSTVGRLLRERGVPVIDADQVARQVVAPGTPGLRALIEAFGPQILAPDGTLDRASMRERISRDGTARSTLNAITHPLIGSAVAAELERLARDGQPVAVVEAALMVETGSYRQYPQVLVVTCSPATQLSRLLARDGTSEDSARALVDAQLPMARKEAVATAVIHNDGALDDLERELDAAWAAMSPPRVDGPSNAP